MMAFFYVVEAGSITAASEQMRLSKAAVSQYIKDLEQAVGTQLLKRTTRRQTVTENGRFFYEHCRKVSEIASGAFLGLQQKQLVPQGAIRITAPQAFMETLITPVISALLEEYPDLKPELISSDAHLDLIGNNIDLAIRVGQSRNSAIKQRKVGEFRDVLSSTKHVAPDHVDTVPYIANTWEGENIELTLHNDAGDSLQYKPRISCTSDSFHTCLSLLLSGAGVGRLPDFIFSRNPTLKRVYKEYQLPINNVYALHTFGEIPPINLIICIKAIEERFKVLQC